MGREDYRRYDILKNEDGTVNMMPYIKISERNSDKFEKWEEGKSRMDIISSRYYGSPFYDFLILYANPKYPSEFDIPSNTLIRIPFPLESAINEYNEQIKFILNS